MPFSEFLNTPQIKSAPDQSAGQGRHYLKLCGELSRMLEETGDYRLILPKLAQSVVPEFADGVLLGLLDEQRKICRVETHALDDGLGAALRELATRYLWKRDGRSVMAEVLSTGKARLIAQADLSWLRSISEDNRQFQLFVAARPRSILVVPVIFQGKVFGNLALISRERSYSSIDLAVFEGIGKLLGSYIRRSFDLQKQDDLKRALLGIKSLATLDLANAMSTLEKKNSQLLNVSNPEQRQVAKFFQRSLEELAMIHQEILEVASGASGPNPTLKDFYPSDEVIAGAIESSGPKILEKRIQIKRQMHRPVPSVFCDKEQMRAVFSECVKTAVDCCPEGGVMIAVVQPAKNGVEGALSFGDSMGPADVHGARNRLSLDWLQDTLEEHGGLLNVSLNQGMLSIGVWLPEVTLS